MTMTILYDIARANHKIIHVCTIEIISQVLQGERKRQKGQKHLVSMRKSVART